MHKFTNWPRAGGARALAIAMVIGLIFIGGSLISRAVGRAQYSIATTLSTNPEGELMPGVMQSYSLKVTNSGTERLTQVIAYVIVDKNFELVGAAGGDIDAKGAAALWKINDLAPQESVTVSFMGRLNSRAAVGDLVGLRLFVSSKEVSKQAVVVPVTRIAGLPENARAQLETFQTIDTETALPGQELLFHIVVHNKGLLPAQGVVIDEQLPRELVLMPETMHPHLSSFATSSAPILDYDENTGRFTVKVDSLKPGDWAAIMYNARVREQTALDRSIKVAANVAASSPQWQASAPIQFHIARVSDIGDDAAGNVGVDVKVDKSDAAIGDSLNYTITVTNNGSQPVNKLKIMDKIPQGLSLVAGSSKTDCGLKVVESSGQVLWKKGTLPAAANGAPGSCAVGFQAMIAQDAATGTITNTAIVKGPGLKAVTGSAQTNVNGAPTATVDIVDFAFNPNALTVSPGTLITWNSTGNAIHTVSSDDCTMPAFNSDDMFPNGIRLGGSFSFFVPANTKSGTVLYYHCRFHGSQGNCSSTGSGMVGMIIVK